MAKKRIVSFTLVLTLIIGIFAVIPSVEAVSSTPVKLIYAKPVDDEPRKIAAQGYVEVENIAYTKRITIHYTFDNEIWLDCSAAYFQPTHANFEAWSFETPKFAYDENATITFAIKYEVDVNGTTQTYWDNNNGQNYSIAVGYTNAPRCAIGNGGLVNSYCYRYPSSNQINGEIQVKNLAYEKTVKILYTVDNWETTNEAYASYKCSFADDSDIEIWNYNYSGFNEETTYKIEYTVNGITYVDDNFGNYYTI